jgi:hypothetical protein
MLEPLLAPQSRYADSHLWYLLGACGLACTPYSVCTETTILVSLPTYVVL